MFLWIVLGLAGGLFIAAVIYYFRTTLLINFAHGRRGLFIDLFYSRRRLLNSQRVLLDSLVEMKRSMHGILSTAEALAEASLSPATTYPGPVDGSSINTLLDAAHQLNFQLNQIQTYSEVVSDSLIENTRPTLFQPWLNQQIDDLAERAEKRGLKFTTSVNGRLPIQLNNDLRLLQIALSNFAEICLERAAYSNIHFMLTTHYAGPAIVRLKFSLQDSGFAHSDQEIQQLLDRRLTIFPLGQTKDIRSHEKRIDLGLELAKAVAEHLRGHLLIKNIPRTGTVYELIVNCTTNSASVAELQPENAFSNFQEKIKSLNILVVDDEPTARKILEKMFEKLGCAATFARDGQEAVNLVNRERFDMIFIDIEMPIMNGWEATQLIRQKYSKQSTFICALSSHSRAIDLKRSFEVGMDEHMSKPLTTDALKQMLTGYFVKRDSAFAKIARKNIPAISQDPTGWPGIEFISKQYENDKSLVDDMLVACVQTFEECLNKIAVLEKQGLCRAADVRDIAHKTRGIFLSLYWPEGVDYADSVEKLTKNAGNHFDYRFVLAQLSTKVVQARDNISRYLKTGSG